MTDPPQAEPARTPRRSAGGPASLIRLAFAAAAVGLLGYTMERQGTAVLKHAEQLTAWVLVVAELAVLAGLCCSGLAWRDLLTALGSPVPLPPAARVFFLGQLGKYLPGSVWSLLAQIEMAKTLHVPRRRSAAAGLLVLALGLLSGLLVSGVLLTLPGTGRYHHPLAFLLGLPAVVLIGRPQLLVASVDLALRVLRRPGVSEEHLNRGLLRRSALWCVLMWLFFGLHIHLLAQDLGAHGSSLPLLATGVFALSWVAGFLVIVAPAGAGIREAVLVAGFGGVLTGPSALVLALVSRLLMTLADAVLATAAFTFTRKLPRVVEPGSERSETAFEDRSTEDA